MNRSSSARGPRLHAEASELPAPVAAALAATQTSAPAGEAGEVTVDGTTWPTTSWGTRTDPPVLLVHGVTSNAGIWWRVGPALAEAGLRVIAVDMPGHGRTAKAPRSHLFADTAAELAAFVRAAGLDRPDLAVVGHSWGGMVTAHLPAAGLRPRTLVLLDPPVLTLGRLKALTEEPTERDYPTLEEAVAAVRAANPTWAEGDVRAKAQALTEFSPQLVLDVLLKNGDWDGGMSALRDPNARGVDVWLIRGDWETGGFIPDFKLPAIERQLGPDHVVTIAGGPHSPQRTHPAATILAILRAIGLVTLAGQVIEPAVRSNRAHGR
ncbi:MAG TPA: alpha/beta hydrolase [Candidatus Limnocylindrales bacterium]|nr:alpha/beta hydrolase [Candidatus Limnocylindrales bacterium]